MSDVRHNVCLIDDDKIYQFTAKMILEATGLTHSIKTFFNGQEAIDYLISPENQVPENLPDVIFLDINERLGVFRGFFTLLQRASQADCGLYG